MLQVSRVSRKDIEERQSVFIEEAGASLAITQNLHVAGLYGADIFPCSVRFVHPHPKYRRTLQPTSKALEKVRSLQGALVRVEDFHFVQFKCLRPLGAQQPVALPTCCRCK